MIAVYRNLHKGTAHNAHAWSVCTTSAGQKKSHGKKAFEVCADSSLLIVNAECRYSPSKANKVRSSGVRSVFAWFAGTVQGNAAGWREGRRLGLRPDNGEFIFCYADTREACPTKLAGVIFNRNGAFEALSDKATLEHWSMTPKNIIYATH